MRILIAVPTFETIYPDTFKSIYDLEKGEHECLFEFVRGYDCATARNKIAQRALDLNTDYVLMVDNDVVLPKDALVNLLDDSQLVTLGYYAQRDADNIYRGKTCIFKLGEFNYTRGYTAKEVKELHEKNKFEIHGGGMGCALIKTEVFNRISYPWFDWVIYKNRGTLSEDLYFCEQCRKHGTKIYSDSHVECGHILRRVQWVE